MKFPLLQIFALFTLFLSASDVDNNLRVKMAKLLMSTYCGGSFSLEEYQSLVEQGGQIEQYHLSFFKSCTDPKGFLDLVCQSGIKPTVTQLVNQFMDFETFDLPYQHATVEVKTEVIKEILAATCNMDTNISVFVEYAPRLINYVGALGLVIPEYIDWFMNLGYIFRGGEPSMVTMDFLKFYLNNGIDFNSPTFTDIKLFEHLIRAGEFELAEFMADNGARLSVSDDQTLESEKNFNLFIIGRLWKDAKFPLILTGQDDPASIVSALPKEVPLKVIGGLLIELCKADTFKTENPVIENEQADK